jgi:2-polyprenyl-6-methoxyphenol hydroxylase-like FAD-dependent oxidoreductase
MDPSRRQVLKLPAKMSHWSNHLTPIEQSVNSAAGSLEGLRLAVVGGGLGGLALAYIARFYGVEVVLLEKSGDPRLDTSEDHSRSFNITLNDVGRAELRTAKAWHGGIALLGRIAHAKDGSIRQALYTGGKNGVLISVPRSRLRANLAQLAAERGAQLHFHTTVTSLDKISADLIAVADGLHSLADDVIATLPGGETSLVVDPQSYISANIPAGELSTSHIHFWYEAGYDTYTVGIPNQDKTITLLLISPLLGVKGDHEAPFSAVGDPTEWLMRQFTQIYALSPDLGVELPGRPMGHFHYKLSSHPVIGPRAAAFDLVHPAARDFQGEPLAGWSPPRVHRYSMPSRGCVGFGQELAPAAVRAGGQWLVVIGDAGSARPPWAGFGGNLALHEAGSLLRCLAFYKGDLTAALPAYQEYLLLLAGLTRDYVEGFGKFMSTRLRLRPEEYSRDALAGLTRAAARRRLHAGILT